MKPKKITTWIIKSIVVIIILVGGTYLWAFTATDTSLIARGLLWGDADAGDLNRFPARLMGPSSHPVEFTPANSDWQNLIAGLPITNADIGAVDMPFDEYLEATNTTAFIVLHGNDLLYEAYFNGSSRESTQMSFSVSKSFASTLVGVAIEEGFIHSLDDPITDYLPELAVRDPRFDQITIRHLLTMASGIAWERNASNPFSDDFISYYSPDLRATALGVEIAADPGIDFVYNDYNPLLIGLILERATGMSISEYMENRLWQPMGAEGAGSWSLDGDASGFEKIFAGLNGRAIDLVKLGWLFLHQGKAGDTQVVSAEWVAAAIQDSSTPNPTYRYYWWVDEAHGMYFAEGDLCQFIYVYPEAQLVIARFGIDCGGTGFSGLIPDLAIWIESQLGQ